jgi:hypothetical protein
MDFPVFVLLGIFLSFFVAAVNHVTEQLDNVLEELRKSRK